jgi:hypothetical protein
MGLKPNGCCVPILANTGNWFFGFPEGRVWNFPRCPIEPLADELSCRQTSFCRIGIGLGFSIFLSVCRRVLRGHQVASFVAALNQSAAARAGSIDGLVVGARGGRQASGVSRRDTLVAIFFSAAGLRS